MTEPTLPRTNAQWKGQIVVVTATLASNGGDVFHPGERLIVKRRFRNGTFALERPKANISGVSPDNFALAPNAPGFKTWTQQR